MVPSTLLNWVVLLLAVALLTFACTRRGVDPIWAALALPPFAVAFALVEPHVPISTGWNELGLMLIAAPSMVCAVVLVRAAALGKFAKGWHTTGLLLLGLMGFLSVAQEISYREDYAKRLTWACDGVLVERATSTDGKQIRTLVVKQDDGVELRFVGVEHALWDDVKIGQHLMKRAGETIVAVDGQPYAMFRRGRAF